MRKKNGFSYDDVVGCWWLKRSLDAAHRRAYRNIADFIRDSFTREPATIVDYACGPGHLLSLLSARFRNSKLVGLDGSSFLLELARRQFESLPPGCAERLRLINTPLPNLSVMRGQADLAIFCFPNMIPFPGANGHAPQRLWLNENDRQVAKSLSLAAEASDETEGPSDPAANRHVMPREPTPYSFILEVGVDSVGEVLVFC